MRFCTDLKLEFLFIDGRECLQRMLVVCLHARRWDDSHMFRATMPARGDCPAPFRTVTGVGFEPGAMRRVLGPYATFSEDVGGALSLEECELAAGDRISVLYDFGEQNRIVFKVVGVERDQALLPEVPFLHHMTRALLGRSGGASTRVRRQYHVSSSDSDASDGDASDGDANELGLDAEFDTP